MPRNPTSEARKQRVVSVLEMRTGPLGSKYPNRDWYCTAVGSVELFITDSKTYTDSKSYALIRPWFDMAESDINQLALHPFGFIVFVLGADDNFLIVPVKDLKAQIPEYVGSKTQNGNYDFHLMGNSFRELPNWSLKPYAEKIELLPMQHQAPTPHI